MRSPSLRIERARPLLGTTVGIRVDGLSQWDAHGAIDEAFAEIALIHRLMAFQQEASDISRLNREAFGRAIDVHPATYEVLLWARELADASGGLFDITSAARLVQWGLLQAPSSRFAPDPEANWRDIDVLEDCCIRFRKPLWIDVSGIAKGYAVDRAVETLKRAGATQALVNAGGDLRVFGPEAERIVLDAAIADSVPAVEIADTALASSGAANASIAPHVDPRSVAPLPPGRFVTVVAETCLLADALTKPVLIAGDDAAHLLRRYGAQAWLFDGTNWRAIV